MARRVETQQQAVFATEIPDNRRYIFFTEPPELWIGDTKFENHAAILAASGRSRRHIIAIGFADQLTSKREVSFDDFGSSNLQIPGGDPDACVTFVRSLPSRGRRITFAARTGR